MASRAAQQNTTLVLESLVEKLLRRDLITPPKTFHKGGNIQAHIKSVTTYVDTIGIAATDGKVAVLMNSLDDAVTLELFSQPSIKDENTFDELCQPLLLIYKKKETGVTVLRQLLNVEQEPGQTLNDFVSQLRIAAYKCMGNADQQRKECYLVRAFINGMVYRKVLRQLKQ